MTRARPILRPLSAPSTPDASPQLSAVARRRRPVSQAWTAILALFLAAAAPGAETTADPRTEAERLKEEAVAVAQSVAREYPDEPPTAALLGSAHYNIGRSVEAAQHLRRCLELDPQLAEAYEILARIAYDRGDMEEAVSLGRESLKRAPGNAEGLNRLGQALMDLGRLPEAVESLQEATRIPRPLAQSFYLLGQAQLLAGEPAAAKASFLRAVAQQPDHTQAFFGLFTACQRLGQPEESAKYREEFSRLETADRATLTDRSARGDTLSGLPAVRQTVARTLFGAGQVHLAHRQSARAAALFQRAARLDPDPTTPYRAALEAAFLQTNALAEGVAAFEALAAEQPTNHLNYAYVGRLQSRRQDFDAAERAFLRVQTLAPSWPEGFRALVDLYLRANQKLPEARQSAERLVELAPTAPHFQLLALTCAKLGDRPAALAAVQHAIDREPREPRYQKLRQQLENAR